MLRSISIEGNVMYASLNNLETTKHGMAFCQKCYDYQFISLVIVAKRGFVVPVAGFEEKKGVARLATNSQVCNCLASAAKYRLKTTYAWGE